MKLILGTAQLGLNYGINNKVGRMSFNESNRLLFESYDNGIRVLDTAGAYGVAHDVIGLFHRNNPGNIFKVISKIPNNVKSSSYEEVVEQYINELFVEDLEVLMFHSFESFLENQFRLSTLNELKEKGRIRAIGVSVYTNEHLNYIVDQENIEVVQFPFNMLDNFYQKGDLLRRLKNKGKILHSRSTFLQGLFFKHLDDENHIVKMLKKELIILHKQKEILGCSMEELAMSYCLRQPYIDNILIGVDSVEQLHLNLKASKYFLDKSIATLIDEVSVGDLNLLNPSLWEKKQF